LARSLEAIRIAGIDLARLQKQMHQTIAAGPFREATVYIQITRGAAPRAHPFPEQTTPLEFLYVQEYHDHYAKARLEGAVSFIHPDLRWQRCDIKSTNLLANVLAMQAAKEAGCVEAILSRSDGSLTEGTHSSLFAVKAGTILTAPKSSAILPGITRALVLDLCTKAGIAVREELLKQSELDSVAELFLTGTTTEVLPVVRVDRLIIGDGRPGPIVRRLQRAFQDAVEDFRRGHGSS
jgi:D-alanine transaminase